MKSSKVILTPVAGLTTVIPNSGGKKFSYLGKPVAGLNTLAFYGSNGGQFGIYLKKFDKVSALDVVCDQSTGLPTIGTPTSIGEIPRIADGGVYFVASNGITQGIYRYDIGTKEIGEIYVCASSETISPFSASRGRVVFEKSNAVDTSHNGIWLIEKDNLANVIITAGSRSPVQINNYPMDANYILFKTGVPFLDGEDLAFVGELKNNATNQIGQGLIRYNLVAQGLLSILKDGDTLPGGNQLVGGTPFKSPLAFRDCMITTKVEYNSSDQSSVHHMVIGIDAQNSIVEVAANYSVTPNMYTNEFALAPMTAGEKIAFVSAVELASDNPSLNLFGYGITGAGILETLIEGYDFPYDGKQYLQSIDQVGESFYGSMIAGRCFWNDGQTGNKDLFGVYAFALGN